MSEAALEHGVDQDQLSLTAAITIIGDALAEFQLATPAQLPRLYRRCSMILRSNPRVVKRKMSKFKLKRAEHRPWPPPPQSFQATLVILN